MRGVRQVSHFGVLHQIQMNVFKQNLTKLMLAKTALHGRQSQSGGRSSVGAVDGEGGESSGATNTSNRERSSSSTSAASGPTNQEAFINDLSILFISSLAKLILEIKSFHRHLASTGTGTGTQTVTESGISAETSTETPSKRDEKAALPSTATAFFSSMSSHVSNLVKKVTNEKEEATTILWKSSSWKSTSILELLLISIKDSSTDLHEFLVDLLEHVHPTSFLGLTTQTSTLALEEARLDTLLKVLLIKQVLAATLEDFFTKSPGFLEMVDECATSSQKSKTASMEIPILLSLEERKSVIEQIRPLDSISFSEIEIKSHGNEITDTGNEKGGARKRSSVAGMERVMPTLDHVVTGISSVGVELIKSGESAIQSISYAIRKSLFLIM